MLRRLLVLCTMSFALLAVAPAIASAHHADITASVDCNGLVSYTTTAWVPPAGTDDTHRVNNSVTVSIDGTQVKSSAFNAGNGYSFGGTYQLPTPLPGSFTATVVWGNFGPTGEYGSAGSGSTGAVTVPPCPVAPAAPGGSVGSVDCGHGGIVPVSLTNTGGQSADITILKNGVAVETVTVAAGGSASRTVTVPEDTTATIALTSGGATLASTNVSVNCIVPPAIPGGSIGDITCANGGAYATLTNTAVAGGADAVFTIKVNGTLLDTDTVVAGATAIHFVPIAEDTTAAIDVTSGAFTASRTLMRDCTPPPALPTTPAAPVPPAAAAAPAAAALAPSPAVTPTPNANDTFPNNGPSVVAEHDSNAITPIASPTASGVEGIASTPASDTAPAATTAAALPFTGGPNSAPLVFLALTLIAMGAFLSGAARHNRLRRERVAAKAASTK